MKRTLFFIEYARKQNEPQKTSKNSKQWGTILALFHEITSERKIAQIIKRSKIALHNFIVYQKIPKTGKKAVPRKKSTSTQLRALFWHALAIKYTARELKKILIYQFQN